MKKSSLGLLAGILLCAGCSSFQNRCNYSDLNVYRIRDGNHYHYLGIIESDRATESRTINGYSYLKESDLKRIWNERKSADSF